jgi:asperthecin polyketide synthase
MAGFVMNGSDETSTQDFFYITPGWADLRIAKPLEAGTPYQSYVRMFPSEEEPNTWVGDIYALQAGEVVGVCGGIKFRKIPRILMARLFSAKEATPQYVHPVGEPKPARRAQLKRPPAGVHVTASSTPSPADVAPEPTAELSSSSSTPASSSVEAASKESSGNDTDKPPLEIVTNVLNLIARETGLPVKEFVDDASFAELGIDSLMSLVLSEKLLKELGVEVKSSIFLECPTVSEFTEWLTQYR